ncbi:MAG: fluoride efflux transporter CrcB [Acidimicrobiales bacterium]
MILAVVVGLAGAFGAVARYVVDGAVADRSRGLFPWGTLTVNVLGSVLLGILTGLVVHHGLSAHAELVGGTGLCGGLTTWSTFSWETIALVEDGAGRQAVANVAVGLGASIAAGAIGMALGSL